jgi:hypothetical protein
VPQLALAQQRGGITDIGIVRDAALKPAVTSDLAGEFDMGDAAPLATESPSLFADLGYEADDHDLRRRYADELSDRRLLAQRARRQLDRDVAPGHRGHAADGLRSGRC